MANGTAGRGGSGVSQDGRIVRSRLRVRFAETDAQGVVYYANYFIYFEVGRGDLLRQARASWREEPGGGIGRFVVVHAECDYKAPAHFDDELEVESWIDRIGRTSLGFGHRVLRMPDGAELAAGRVTVVHLGTDGKPLPVPEAWRRALERYMAPVPVADR